MSRVIFQPTGSIKKSNKNYTNTIVNSVDIKKIKEFVTEEQYENLFNLYPEKLIPTWGISSGKNEANVKKWNSINTGDLVFFTADKEVHSYGFVTFKLHNSKLAEELWGKNEEGNTWEYIYFLSEIKKCNIPQSFINEILGYNPKYAVQGVNVLKENQSNTILAHFDFENETDLQEVSKNEYEDIIRSYDRNQLDTEHKAKGRREQAYLRKTLFKNELAHECEVCGVEYPIQFLVAAHIKKRAFCSPDEKLDFENIVIPMCKFGCDDLFERGYISIIDGQVVSNKKFSTESIDNYINKIEGRTIKKWNAGTAKYFSWHSEHHLFLKNQ